MLVSSSDFQQRVGYYLELADAGEDIFIKKYKPKGKMYKLQVTEGPIKRKSAKKIIEEIEAMNLKSNFSSGLELQRHARS